MKIRLLLAFLCILIIACKPEKNNDIIYSEDPEINELSKLLAKKTNDKDLLKQRAQIYARKQAFSSAITDLKHAINIDSTDADLYHFLSDCYMDSYKSRLALETMIDASKLFPNRIITLLKLAETQFILQQYDRSMMTINTLLSKDPQNAEAYFMLGLNFRDMGELASAKNAFQTATEFDSEIIDAWIILGNIYESENNPKALDYYKTATSVDPNSPQAWHSLAYYLQNHGDIDTALEYYKKINTIDKEYSDAYLNAGVLYLEKENLDKAFEQFNLLVSNSPTYYRGYIYRGLVHKLKGDFEAGDKDISSALNLTNQDEKIAQEVKEIEKNFGINQ